MSYEHRQALPAGTRLHEYELLHVLGSGGFGVVYLAHDHELEQKVVIKEYLPGAFAVRLAGNTVVPTSPKEEGNFQWGLDSFLNEARALAEFRQCPNIVSVLRYFKANNTGYMVMEYAGAVSLQDFLEVHETLTEKQLVALVLPLLGALETIHAKGVIHRDIKPGNILINDDSQPVLIDFGAARQAVGERSMSLTAILTQGYAPFEQYHKLGQQGPWTDIYALAAVMYRCVTGVTPPESTARMDASADRLSVVEETARGDYASHLLAAIDWGLQLRVLDRPQSIAEWRHKMEALVPAGVETPASGWQRLLTVIHNLRLRQFSARQGLLASLLAGMLLLGIALLFMPASDGGSNPAVLPVVNPAPQPIGAVAPTVEQPAAPAVVSGAPEPETAPPAIEIVPEPEVMPPVTEQAPPRVVVQKTPKDGKAGNKSGPQKSGSGKSQAGNEAREQAKWAEAEAARRRQAQAAAEAAAARKRQKSGDSRNPFANGQYGG